MKRIEKLVQKAIYNNILFNDVYILYKQIKFSYIVSYGSWCSHMKSMVKAIYCMKG